MGDHSLGVRDHAATGGLMSENDLISRIDGLLDDSDQESLDDWAYLWSNTMRWAPCDAGDVWS